MTLPDVLPTVAVDDLRALVARLTSGAENEIVFETQICAAGDRTYPAELCMQYFADESPPILVAIVHDISARERLPG